MDQEIEQEPAEIIEEEVAEEEREQQYEDDAETSEEYDDLNPGAVPQPEEQKNILTFLKDDVLEGDDRFKTANLTWEELGKPNFSTRFWLNLSNTCEKLFKMDIVAVYCRLKARITTDTSLSRDGFIIQTAVTQRRVKEKKGISELAKFMNVRK